MAGPFEQRFSEMLEVIGRTAADLSNPKLTGFLAIKGAAYSGELMWVGRAVNGWTSEWSPSQLTPEVIPEIARSVSLASKERESNLCPLNWVTARWGARENQYSTARSAFWRAAKKTLLRADEVDESWSSRLVWSNLYKIAPHGGGNPGGKLAAIQFPFCRDLLWEEIEVFRPRRIVFATGLNWAESFIESPNFERADLPPQFSEYVHGFGNLVVNNEKIGKFVIAPHPQGKNSQRWVKDVAGALEYDGQ